MRAIVSQKLSNETDMIVGLLHDVLEDTDITEATIRNLFGDEIADALVAMTHMPGVPYEDYIRGIAQNPVSRRVKIADLEHNMDMSRLHEVTQKDLKRLEKYQRAKEYLLSADTNSISSGGSKYQNADYNKAISNERGIERTQHRAD